jgi:hypothetical protein
MGTSWKQEKDFRDAMISDKLLEEAIGWIRSNLAPEDVFKDDQLGEWAKDMGYTKESP